MVESSDSATIETVDAFPRDLNIQRAHGGGRCGHLPGTEQGHRCRSLDNGHKCALSINPSVGWGTGVGEAPFLVIASDRRERGNLSLAVYQRIEIRVLLR